MTEPILLSVSDGVARVTLNRPDRLNAIDAAAARRWRDVAEEVTGRADVRAVVLDAAGPALLSTIHTWPRYWPAAHSAWLSLGAQRIGWRARTRCMSSSRLLRSPPASRYTAGARSSSRSLARRSLRRVAR